MRSCLLIAACLLALQTRAQSTFSAQCYTYLRSQQRPYASPIVQYQSNHSWYAEARYNYEEYHSFSVYAGRTFSNVRTAKEFSYPITPIAGILEGRLRGISAGLNAELDFKSIYFSTQSQYCISWRDCRKDFFFSWSEIGYRPLKWLAAGLSVQQTNPYHAGSSTEPGLFVSITSGPWSFPLYAFRTSQGPCLLVAGIVRECGHTHFK
jgi:hypothetical protein